MISPPLIAVLGAGMAGCMAARKLLQAGYRVKLIDLNEEMMGNQSSTRNSARRIHLGFHYFAHLDTAKECHQYALDLIKEFPNCLAGDDPNLPWRRGRYYVMSNTLTDSYEITHVVRTIKQLYVKEYKACGGSLFGPPENVIVDITNKPELYPEIAKEIEFVEADGTISRQRVICAYETAESQLDIKKLRGRLKKEHAPHQRSGQLTEHFLTEVTDIQHRKNVLGYVVRVKHLDTMTEEEYAVDGVVNCTWQNIEKINRGLALPPTDNQVTYIRPKVFLTIELPDLLKDIHTSIFCVGPFAGISNFGDGTGMITYEIVTGVGQYDVKDEPPEPLKKIMKGEISPALVQGILQGCAKYLEPPYREALLQAKILEVNLGYVRQNVGQGEMIDIRAKESSHHMRLESGLQPLTFAFVNFVSQKISFANHLARELVPILNSHLKLKENNESVALVEFGKRIENNSAIKSSIVIDSTLPDPNKIINLSISICGGLIFVKNA